MSRKKPKPDDEAQKKRFIEKARELEVDESEEAFEKAFRKVVPPSKPSDAKPSKA